MRIMIKGGVWKNTEDEILKAAVMKYGLNQWARISSLLVRKSAKQCKARWYEWLDPSIKKTEWTREEDEKLLHLAKLMPTQWRTIAPIVGRTPAQCLERYDKLLDMAVAKDERYDPADDPRRLRPGEIDPNPESKPARPDPVDMDEDEKEMLSEARARLANTRGKKAKRKAREKQLEEARRLAALQKKRELKAAGIEMRGHRKRKGVDYSAEVAFEKKPAPGFFDTAEEDAVSRQMQGDFRPVTLEELEGRRRKDIEEGLMKRDLKKQRTDGADAPLAAARAGEEVAAGLPRRGKMMLPAPQVSEAELQQIARLQAQGVGLPELEDGAGGDATRQLLGQYQTPALMPTPARTPRTAGTQDRVMLEAQNLARMQAMQTPLLGGDNPDLHPSDFTGATPRAQVAQTPNPLATPSLGGTVRRAIAGVPSTPSIAGTPLHGGATPALGHIPGATPMRTPMRDELGLNDSSSLVPADSKRAERLRQVMMRNELKAGLSQLPAPENEYQVVVPELPEDEGEGGAGMEEDAADAKARRAREEAARLAAEELKKSQVLQRGLPRPAALERPLDVLRRTADVGQQGSWRERAEAELAGELAALLQHDDAKYPLGREGGAAGEGRGKKDKKRDRGGAAAVPALRDFELAELQAASQLLKKETEAVKAAMRHAEVPLAEYVDTWAAVRKDLIYLPSQGAYGRAASATNSDRLESVRREHELAHAEMGKAAKRAAKLEDKVKVVLGGLWGRNAALTASTPDLHASRLSAQEELACFRALQEQEARTVPARLEAMRDLLQRQRVREAALQDRYRALQLQRDDLLQALNAAPMQQ